MGKRRSGPKMSATACRLRWSEMIEWVLLDDQGAPCRLASHHRLILDHIRWCWLRGQRAGVIAPMGHGKTTLLVGLVLHLLGTDPNQRVKIICGDENEAKKRLRSIARYIEQGHDEQGVYSEIFSGVMPDDKEAWSTTQLFLRRDGMSADPSVEARSVLAGALGSRADVEVFDDVVTAKVLEEPSTNRRIIERMEQVYLTRLEPNGKAVMIGTPFASDDALAHFQRVSSWCFLRIAVSEGMDRLEVEAQTSDPSYPASQIDGAECSARGWRAEMPLWDRWSSKALANRRADIGRVAFARGYHCRPETSASATFQNWKRALVPEMPEEHSERPAWAELISMGVDPAAQNRRGTAFVLLGLVRDHTGGYRRRVIHAELRRFNAPQTCERACELYGIYRPDIFVPEVNAYQRAAITPTIDLLMTSPDARLARLASGLRGTISEKFTTGDAKASEAVGVAALDIAMSNNQLVVPAGTMDVHTPPCIEGEDGWACAWCELIHQLGNHPNSKDDLIMALWLAWIGLREIAGDVISDGDEFEAVGVGLGGGGMSGMGLGPDPFLAVPGGGLDWYPSGWGGIRGF